MTLRGLSLSRVVRQADALVLRGGYLLFAVFRGDNTVPVFDKALSPLHNRCLILLSKMPCDGGEVYWDNLYPSRVVAAKLAAGCECTAKVPAGANAGETITLTVPKTGTAGTMRTNRGIDPAVRQPDKKGMSEKVIAELKGKPLSERVKSSMTKTEPRVLFVSVFDNGPVHLISTIHTEGDEIRTIERKRWDASKKEVALIPIERLALIDDYNHTMDFVDIFDQLGHYYNVDGHTWRDRKWWMPIFKSLFKGACDNGYVLYKRVCELAEEKRLAELQLAEKRAEQRRERAGGSPAGGTRTDQALEKLRAAKKIVPMSHFDFLEKIAEGFVIEAYNSTKKKAEQHIKLDAYNLERLERAIAEMRGDAAPSGQARGDGPSAAARGSSGGKSVKKRLLVRKPAHCIPYHNETHPCATYRPTQTECCRPRCSTAASRTRWWRQSLPRR